MNEKSYLLTSVAKACDVILLLGPAKTGLSVSEIAASLNLPQSTVSKILATLQAKELVAKSAGGKYHLSALFSQMAMGNYTSFFGIHKKMEELLAQFGETIHFGVRSGDSLLVVDKFNGTQRISITSEVGKRSPLLAVSLGKAIVAFMPEDVRREIVENYHFKARTQNTIVDKEAMYRELEKIRAEGYAYDDEECDEFVQCVGVPVLGADGEVFGGVSISVAKFRMTEEYRQQLAQALMGCDFGVG